jgi:mannosyltransferase
MAVVHGIALLSNRRNRDVFRLWLMAVVVGLLLASPVIFWALREHNQIGFLARRHRVDVLIIIAEQWFGSLWLAVPCWALVIFGCVVSIRRWRSRNAAPGEGLREPMVLVLAWFAVPTVLILIGNYVVQPMYTDRYLSFSAPAAAILVGVGVAALPFAWLRWTAVIAIVALAAPVYLSQRTEFGKPGGSDWAQASAVIGRLAHPGDGIVFDETVKPSWRPRLAMHLYPDDYQGLDDIALTLPFQESSGLRDHVAPLSRLLPRLNGVSTVWAIDTTLSNDTSPTSNLPVLERNGFTIIRTVKLHRTIIYELTRSLP